MSTQIKGFVSRDDFVTPRNQDVSSIFEISDSSLTYAKKKQSIYPDDQQKYCLTVFNAKDTDVVGERLITQIETKTIVRVVSEFTVFLTGNPVISKQQALIGFTTYFNNVFPATPITGLSYNNTVSNNLTIAPDYLTFTVLGISCSLWVSDEMFSTFYPDYDIGIVLPFENFKNTILNVSVTLDKLTAFDPVVFTEQLEANRESYPATTTRIINIPYHVPNTTVERNCYFGFNIYGRHGNYDHILKLELYRYLTEDLLLDPTMIQEIFPSILRINEFFVVPRWERLAIPTQVGQVGINSQVSLTYDAIFDTDKFVTIYPDNTDLKRNTYNVPFPYNNILLNITNGYYSEELIKKFPTNYPDLIAVSSISPDFGRMKTTTQLLVTMLENMLEVANANNQTELFNKVITNNNYLFTIIDRGGVTYVSLLFQGHQYYLVPKYEFLSLA